MSGGSRDMSTRERMRARDREAFDHVETVIERSRVAQVFAEPVLSEEAVIEIAAEMEAGAAGGPSATDMEISYPFIEAEAQRQDTMHVPGYLKPKRDDFDLDDVLQKAAT